MYKANEYNILIIFFNNLDRFKAVFEMVKKARPANLFLYQDGPRNESDFKNIAEIRKYINDSIDWECNVYKKYQEKNYGCDPSEFISQKWAFSIVDKCIVLEDDDVPSMSFFRFCWDLLIKYENDERISIICGMNNLDTFNLESGKDYFFTSSGCIWGWASWKRVIDSWDSNYSWLDDPEKLKAIRPYFSNTKKYNNFIKLSKKRRESGIEYYETILGVSQMLNHQLNIVPTLNLISNIGIIGGVHTTNNSNTIPKKMRSLYYKKTFEIQFPLRHPDTIYDNLDYKRKLQSTITLNFLEKVVLKLKRIFVIGKK